MRKNHLLFGLFALLPFLAACHQDEEELFATAEITLSAGDTLTIERVQGTARLTNLNSKQTTSSSDFDGATLRLELLRSSYSADVEGLLRYRNRGGASFTKRIRAHSDYLALEKTGRNEAVLEIIFLE